MAAIHGDTTLNELAEQTRINLVYSSDETRQRFSGTASQALVARGGSDGSISGGISMKASRL